MINSEGEVVRVVGGIRVVRVIRVIRVIRVLRVLRRLRMPIPFCPRHGHYRNLMVYQVAEIIYDITYHFAHRFLAKGDRTIDQMVQAARSGKQNIAEGNRAATTSSETEIKLTNVAKASLEELLDDYEDYLRVRGLEQWGALHPRYQRMREYASGGQIRHTYASMIPRMTDEEIAIPLHQNLQDTDFTRQFLIYISARRGRQDDGHAGGWDIVLINKRRK